MFKLVLTVFFWIFALPVLAKSFSEWKRAFAVKAVNEGLPVSYTLEVLKGVRFDPTVIRKDRNQVHLNKKLDYLKFISKWKGQNQARLKQAREKMAKNLKLLEKVERHYGVDKEVIISLWGVETYFGRITGQHDVIRSLATLAYDGRREAFFEKELKSAILMLYRGHVSRAQLKGSWAGATGQCQFMPSNHHLAQDFDKDGRKDIWSNKADIFASIANYLKQAGWKKGQKIGILALNSKKLKIPENTFKSPQQYHQLGFKTIDGSSLAQATWKQKQAALIPLQNSPVVLKGANYQAIMKWNSSVLFVAFNIILMNALRQINS